jgi:hypothetical protein
VTAKGGIPTGTSLTATSDTATPRAIMSPTTVQNIEVGAVCQARSALLSPCIPPAAKPGSRSLLLLPPLVIVPTRLRTRTPWFRALGLQNVLDQPSGPLL